MAVAGSFALAKGKLPPRKFSIPYRERCLAMTQKDRPCGNRSRGYTHLCAVHSDYPLKLEYYLDMIEWHGQRLAGIFEGVPDHHFDKFQKLPKSWILAGPRYDTIEQ